MGLESGIREIAIREKNLFRIPDPGSKGTGSGFATLVISVADPRCSSRFPDPDFYLSWISDPGSRIQKQKQKTGLKKKLVVIPVFVAPNLTKF
jgi:hypothetical protein